MLVEDGPYDICSGFTSKIYQTYINFTRNSIAFTKNI